MKTIFIFFMLLIISSVFVLAKQEPDIIEINTEDYEEEKPFKVSVYKNKKDKYTNDDIKWGKINGTKEFFPIFKNDTKYKDGLLKKPLSEIHFILEDAPKIEKIYNNQFVYDHYVKEIDFSNFTKKNKINSTENEPIYPSFIDSVWNWNWKSFEDLKEYMETPNGWIYSFYGEIVDLDPTFNVSINSTDLLPYPNQTEGSIFGASLEQNITQSPYGQFWGYKNNIGNFKSWVYYNESYTGWSITSSLSDSNGSDKMLDICNNDANCVSYWNFNDNVTDLKGSNDITGLDSVTNTTGLTDNALFFNLGVANVTSDSGLNFEYNEPFSMSGWVFMARDGNIQVFVARRQDSSDRGYVFAVTSADKIEVVLQNGNSNRIIVDGSTDLLENKWYHVGFTYDGSGDASGIEIYVNGKDESETIVLNTLASKTIKSSSFLEFGNQLQSGLPFPFLGVMDNFVIYNKTLSKNEMYNLFKSGLSQNANNNITTRTRTANEYNLTDSDLVSLWAFNADNNGTDEMGINNGSCSSCPEWSEDYGVVGGGYNFDSSSSEYINISDSGLLDIDESNMSISVWVKRDVIGSGHMILEKSDGANEGYFLFLTATNLIRFLYANETDSYTKESVSTISDTGWHHIVVILNRDTGVDFYIDGELDNTVSQPLGGSMSNNVDLVIGKRATSSTFFMNGNIDELKIYNKTISPAEARSLYENGNSHILWNEWKDEGKSFDLIPLTSSNSGRFMQFENTFNSENIYSSPYLLNYSISMTETTYDFFPNITNVSPINNTNISSSPYTISFNATVVDDVLLKNVSLYINGIINQTNSSGLNGDYLFYVSFPQENLTYNWNICAIDTENQENCSTNRTLFTHYYVPLGDKPNVVLLNPSVNYFNDSSDPVNIDFNCSATDDNQLINISLYITNNLNTSFSLNQTTDISGVSNQTGWTVSLSNGDYTWNCIAYDNNSQFDWDINRTVLINYTSPPIPPPSSNGILRLFINDSTGENVTWITRNGDIYALGNISSNSKICDSVGCIGDVQEYNDTWINETRLLNRSGLNVYLTDTNYNFGIGTTNAEYKLHLYEGDSTASPHTLTDMLIEDDDTVLLSMLSPNNKISGIMFGDPEHSYSGYIRYSHVDDSMKLYSAGSNRVTIDSSGNVGVGTSNPTSKLHVYEDSSSYSQINLSNSDGDGLIRVDNNKMFLYTNNTDEFVLTDGKIGIKTSKPNATIHVNGDAIIEKNLTVKQSATIEGNIYVEGNINVTGCICYDNGGTCLGTCV